MVGELCHFLIRSLVNAEDLVNPQANVLCNMLAFKRFTHHSDKIKDIEGPLWQVYCIDTVINRCLVRKCFGFEAKAETIEIKHHLWHVVMLWGELKTPAVIIKDV